jgi:hypothetical protein
MTRAMRDSRLRIVVTGLVAQYPLGGVTWDYLQYPLGLARMGHDVYYLEDSGQWPYDPVEGGLARRPDRNARYVAHVMERFGLGERWAYRFPWQSQWFGMPEARRREVVASADLLINVSGTLDRPQDYRGARRMAYVDSDPMFTQIKLAKGQTYFRDQIDVHDAHFTFGESPESAAPCTGHRWRATRQPVYEGRSYGQKDVEFLRFLDLPGRVAPTVLEVAANVGKTRHTPRGRLARLGWRIVDPDETCPDLDSYRAYIQSSKAEWSVAKQAYVAGRTGWFSCRSACYLASGRPVVVQDTGFSAVLPVGEGIVPFTTLEGAVEGVRSVEADYARHAEAARAIVEACFDSATVLEGLIGEAFADAG